MCIRDRGLLAPSSKEGDRRSRAAVACRGGPAAGAALSELDHEVGALRRVPWQTPRTYEADGELR
eukprot:166378-Alexandrium_andersonii.AAC.1